MLNCIFAKIVSNVKQKSQQLTVSFVCFCRFSFEELFNANSYFIDEIRRFIILIRIRVLLDAFKFVK